MTGEFWKFNDRCERCGHTPHTGFGCQRMVGGVAGFPSTRRMCGCVHVRDDDDERNAA